MASPTSTARGATQRTAYCHPTLLIQTDTHAGLQPSPSADATKWAVGCVERHSLDRESQREWESAALRLFTGVTAVNS